jgi:hypothetical protein
MDMVVTTRLHGAVLALKNGIPVLAVEVDPKGAKLRRQMETICWPIIFVADNLDDEAVERAFDYCLTKEARVKATECYARASKMLEEVNDRFAAEIGSFGEVSADPVKSDRKSRIHSTNRTRLSLEAYPHTYHSLKRESGNNKTEPWLLRVAEENIAHLYYRANTPGAVRIAITNAGTETSYDIQLNHPQLKVRSNDRYVVRFLARADRSRRISVGCARACEPWTNLGLYRHIELTPEWQSFEITFTATADEENARIHFDVGGNEISVEFSAFTLDSMADAGHVAVPATEGTL